MYKKGLFSIMIAGLVFFTSCSDDKKSDEGKDKDNDKDGKTTELNDIKLNVALPEGVADFDLSEFALGLNAIIKAPEAAYIYDSELITDDTTYSQVIIQMADDSDVRFSIGPCLESMEDIKNFIKQDMFREFKRFLLDDGKGVIYEAVKNSDESIVYHFTLLVENEGIIYKIESDSFHDYTIEEISQLYAMAQSISFK